MYNIFATEINPMSPYTRKAIENLGMQAKDVQTATFEEFQDEAQPDMVNIVGYLKFLNIKRENLREFIQERLHLKSIDKVKG